MAIHTIIGPPGTGKTTKIHRMVQSLIQRTQDSLEDISNSGESCVLPENIVICSMTRTAAQEAQTRIPELPDANIGTFHSFCKTAVRGKKPMDSPDGIRAVNKWIRKAQGGETEPGSLEEFLQGKPEYPIMLDGADHPLAQWMLARARRDSNAINELGKRDHIAVWQRYKREHPGAADFQDWIDQAARTSAFNGLQSEILVCLVDECQDLSRAEYETLMAWHASTGGMMDIYFVGDPMQSLYRFRGAEPLQCFKNGYDVLEQSYRLPHYIREFADRLARRCPEYVEQSFRPRPGDFKGNVGIIAHHAQLIELADDVLCEDQTAMFLASTEFGLEDFTDTFLKNGIPFGNFFRPDTKRWNPMRRPEAVLFRTILKQADHRVWTVREFAKVLAPFEGTKHLAAAAGEVIEKVCVTAEEGAWKLIRDRHISDRLREVLAQVEMGDPLSWLEPYLDLLPSDDLKPWLRYYARVMQVYGKEYLRAAHQQPILVGTCHSVKGGEADVVCLSDHLTYKLHCNASDDREYSDIVRTFYVGATRAKESLYIHRSTDRYAMHPLMEIVYEISNTEGEHVTSQDTAGSVG